MYHSHLLLSSARAAHNPSADKRWHVEEYKRLIPITCDGEGMGNGGQLALVESEVEHKLTLAAIWWIKLVNAGATARMCS